MDRDNPLNEVYITRGLFPYGFWREFKAEFSLAWPTSLGMLFHYLIQPISLMFCGHLGKAELTAASMAISVIYLTSISIGRGLAFGGDTFFSQCYGSSNKKKTGVYLQRSLIFAILCCFPIWAILLNTRTLLILTGQDVVVATMAQEYTQLFMPGALAYCCLFTLMRYLLCQNSVLPNLFICFGSCAINAMLHYVLLYQAGMGIKGSAIALMLTYYLVCFLLFAYIWGSGMYRETWAGWTFECLEDWGEFAKVSVASIFMTFIFWLCTEIGTFLSGLQGTKEISAFQIMFQVEGFAWMVPLGVGGACTARVGQFLGAREPLGAVTSCRVALTVQIFISLAMAGATWGLSYYIPMLFTTNKELIDYTAKIMPICAIFVLLEGFGGVGLGIVRGTGRQTLGTYIILVSYYVFALPIGISLMFATYLGLAGLWWGLVIGLAVQDSCLLLFVAKMDWEAECDKAQARAGVLQPEVTAGTGSSVNAVSQDAGEDSRLLPDHVASVSYDSVTPINSSGSGSSPRQRIILLRLLTVLLLVLVLVAGVLARLFVQISGKEAWEDLCIPLNETKSDFFNDVNIPWNYTIPFCSNETTTHDYSDYPLYAIWL